MNKKVLIVGGVAGGASCAARLRRLDEEAEIIIFERGEHVSYANCGLPYRVGGEIETRDALLVLKTEFLRDRFKADVRLRSEVVSIDRNKKRVTVKELQSGRTYEESYDALVLATGSSPLRPDIPGITSPRVATLWTVEDAEHIRAMIERKSIESAVVVGGGFIGLETAENLHAAGVKVTLVEALDQVMTPLDFEMAQLLHERIRDAGVELILGDAVASFRDEAGGVLLELKSGKSVGAQLAILSIGVRPNCELARGAGLKVNERGGVVTDAAQRTSDPCIFAVGDVTEVEEFVMKGRAMIPLAGPANKQGRVAADNIAGVGARYGGTQGTSIARVFGLAAAATGMNEKKLQRLGLEKGRDYESLIIAQKSHAGYYPGWTPLTLKLVFSLKDRRVLGAQAVGGGADKRIDTISAAMRFGASVGDLKELEFAYAPPFSSAKDPVNMAGYVAENLLAGLVRFCPWDEMERNPEALLIEVREERELAAYKAPGALHIPLGKLRERLGELEKYRGGEIIILCAIGARAYTAARILAQHGFENVSVYPGGAVLYRAVHHRARRG